MRRSRLLVMASRTNALSCSSAKVASQSFRIPPVPPPAFHADDTATLVSACLRISADFGGALVAHAAKSVRPDKAAKKTSRERMAASVQFQDQPIQLGANSNDHFTNDVNGVTAVCENSSCACGACRQKDVLILCVCPQTNCEAVRRDGGNTSGWHKIANGQLPLRGCPHD